MTLKCNRTGFIRGIPARDLTDAEVEQYGGEEYLIGTGLYERTLFGFPMREVETTEEEWDMQKKFVKAQGWVSTRHEQPAQESKQTRKNKRANQDGLAKEE